MVTDGLWRHTAYGWHITAAAARCCCHVNVGRTSWTHSIIMKLLYIGLLKALDVVFALVSELCEEPWASTLELTASGMGLDDPARRA